MKTSILKIAMAAAFMPLALFHTQSADAGGPLAVCESGQSFLWPAGGSNIPFNPDQGDLGPLTNAQAVQLTDDSFAVWGNVSTSTASYTNAGLLPVDVDVTNFGPYLNPLAPDGLSAIVFDDDGQIFDALFGPGSGILGFAGPEWVNTLTCEILEGVSFLNGPAFSDLTAAFDVMVHEFGHYSNLAHTEVNGQLYIGVGDLTGPEPEDPFGPIPNPIGAEIVETMYPFYFGPGIGTNTLHADDIASLSTLYPDASFAATTGSISGTIFAPNGTTRLTGVNVIARNEANPFQDAVSAISSDFTDSTSQADPVVGTYTIEGLTPGASYRVYVDEILAGGFSTPLLTPLPGPEEYASGASESNSDDPASFEAYVPAAGADISGTDVIFNTPQPGDPLPVGDDGFVEVFMPFEFELCGQSFDSVWVNANGNITFGAPSSDFSESAGEFLSGPPRIAGLWDDLNPSAGGVVTFDQSKNTFTVIYDSVPEFFDTGSNSFSITLKRRSNNVDLDYGSLTATDGLAGVSCGSSATSGFEPGIDLTAEDDRINMTQRSAAYEVFNFGNPVDLSGELIEFNGSMALVDKFESNDSLGTAASITLPFDSIDNKSATLIDPVGGDVDYFRFSAESGTSVIAEVLTGSLDSVLGLFDSNGTLVAVDDDGGTGLLSRVVFPIPADGDYTLAVSTFPDFGFTGAGGSGGRYVLAVESIEGTLLNLGDDDSEELTLPFSFPFQGSSYGSVFVNSNGNLTFGSGDSDFSESVSEFLNDQPRIAALWDDLSPNQGGLVIADVSATEATISFDNVPEFFASTGNSFDVTIRSDGSITVAYGTISASDGIAGVTEGGGVADPGVTDLSANPAQSATGTTYEQFTFGNPNDLSGITVDYTP